jgi:1-acyl-sn-glycerol-3-phosphate acyltransferase
MSALKKICKFIFDRIGWKAQLNVAIPPKCVFVVAPHTSNWDFIMGEIMYQAFEGDGKVNFLIKKEWFNFPFNYIMGPMGGVPVNRGHSTSLVNQLVNEFQTRDHMRLAITPEGTRKPNPKWKMGFYHIAKSANVPILMVYLDYEKKVAGIDEIFIPTDDEAADIQYIKQYYTQFKGKHPESFAI